MNPENLLQAHQIHRLQRPGAQQGVCLRGRSPAPAFTYVEDTERSYVCQGAAIFLTVEQIATVRENSYLQGSPLPEAVSLLY